MMHFNQAEKKFKQLKAQFAAGTLSETEFKGQLEDLMVQDEQGDWWMIGYETERWYRHDGTNWVQSEPPSSSLLKHTPEIIRPKIDTTAPLLSPKEKESIWQFGKKEIIQSAIGLGIYIVLFFIFRREYIFRFWSPAFAVPLFFGLTFGPIVGIIVGALSYILTYPILIGGPLSQFFYYFSTLTLFSNALKGLITGMAKVPTNKFRSRSGIFRAELFVIIAIFVPTTLFTEWASLFRNPDFLQERMIQNILPSLLGNLLLIPIGMIIYSIVISRIKKPKNHTSKSSIISKD